MVKFQTALPTIVTSQISETLGGQKHHHSQGFTVSWGGIYIFFTPDTSLLHIVIVFITPLTPSKRVVFITPILPVKKIRPLTG